MFVLGGTWLLEQQDNLFYNFSGGVSILFSFAIFALEIFIGALQAYIFTVLTAQYVSSAQDELANLKTQETIRKDYKC